MPVTEATIQISDFIYLLQRSNFIRNNNNNSLLHRHYSPMQAFASIMDLLHISGVLTGSFLRSGVVNPMPNPQPGTSGSIFITPGTG